jgi:Fungal specific transcription factor domain
VPENKILGESLGLQSHRHGRYLGLSSPFEPLLIGLSPFDARNESLLSLGTLRRVNDNETFIMLPDDSTQDFADDAEALEDINRVVSPHGSALLELYFRVVHPFFPIIQKHVFVERIRNGEKNFSPALVAGMYLLALNWWAYDKELSRHPRPSVDELDNIATRSLAAAMQRPKLSTVQAGLLLLQRPETDSWSLTTQLVAIGQEIGLHLDCTSWDIPPWERGLRKRIAWALYMQDKWSSLIHGRPSHIFAANWAVKPLLDEDTTIDSQINPNLDPEGEEEKNDMETGKMLFSQMIGLTKIMAEVMDSFYTQVAIQEFADAGNKSTQLILERAKPVQIKLKDWFSRLPDSLRMDSVIPNKLAPQGKSVHTLFILYSDNVGFLHLAYFATEITLHRRIIQSLNQETSEQYLQYICRSAAKSRLISAMDFVNRLRPEHLQAFWYFPSKINFTLIGTFGGLLWATAPSAEEADFYKFRMREYRWTLSVSSRRAQFLAYAVQMLDASRAMLKNLAQKPSLSRVNSAGVPTLSAMSSATHLAGRAKLRTEPMEAEEDVNMEDAPPEDTPPLTRTTSVSNVSGSVFTGFSTDVLDAYTAGTLRPGAPPTPPSSTG